MDRVTNLAEMKLLHTSLSHLYQKKNTQIVIVEKDRLTLKIVENAFNHGGYKNIQCFNDGKEAFSFICKSKKLVIGVYNFHADALNALQFLTITGKIKDKIRLKVVVVCDSVSPDLIVSLKKFEVMDIWLKPLNQEKLLKTIESIQNPDI